MLPSEEASSAETSPTRLAELTAQSEELALLVAKNPNTPSALLVKLLSDPKDVIRRAVVQNPNIPIDKFLLFAGNYPQAFQDNPLFSLLLLEDPSCLKRISEHAFVALLGLPSPDQTLVEYAVTLYSPGCRALAAAKVVKPELAKRLLADSESSVAYAAIKNKNLPERLFERFEAVSLGSELPEIELNSLAGLGLWPCVFIVSAKLTPLSVISFLLQRYRVEVCLAVLARPEIPSSMLEDIFKEYSRSAANTPRKVDIFLGIAKHPNCSAAQLLSVLKASSYSTAVQEAAAVHPVLDAAGMMIIAGSAHFQAKVLLTKRLDLPLSVQEMMSEDIESRVRAELVKAYPTMAEERKRWRSLLESRALSEEDALTIAKRGDDAAFDLLKHPNTPARQRIALQISHPLSQKISSVRLDKQAVDLLLEAKSTMIGVALARSYHIPEESLLRLASLERPVQEQLYKSHRYKKEVLLALLEHQFPPAAETLLSGGKATSAQLLLILRKVSTPWKRLLVQLSQAPELPREALSVLLPRYWFHVLKHPRLGDWCKEAELVKLFPKAMKRRLKKIPTYKALLEEHEAKSK